MQNTTTEKEAQKKEAQKQQTLTATHKRYYQS